MSVRQELLLANTWAVRDDRRDAIGKWATDATVGTFLDPLRDAGWLERATHYWADDTPVTPIPPAPELDDLVRAWRDQTAAFFAGNERDPDWKFWLSMRTTEAMTELTIADLEPRSGLRDRFTRIVAAWTKGLEGTPLQASIGALTPWGAPYDRPVPHRESQWPLGAIDYYLGRSWHDADPARAAVLHAIEHAPLPPGITRTVEGDILHVTFECDLADADSIAAARARGERWFAPLVQTRLAPGWNERGDRLAEIADRDELAPFTFFDTRNGIGYKALVVDSDTGAIDEALWKALVDIAKAKQAPDGTAVKEVRVIVPTRDDAVGLIPRAQADGLDVVAYPEERSFYCVSPTASVS
jgi:hypothetical protein